jgi:pyruvate formate lyase activating enzyme
VLESLKSVNQIDLLPYHRFGLNKYAMLGRPYSLSHLMPCAKENIERARQIIGDEFNFKCQIAG